MKRRKILTGLGLAVLVGVLAGVVSAESGMSGAITEDGENYDVTFGDRHLSIPTGYFQGTPRHDQQGDRQYIYLRYLWPSMEGKSERNASAFNDPSMPVNGVLMEYIPGRTVEELVAAPWASRTNNYQPSSQDPLVGEFRLADGVLDRDGYPIDIYYRLGRDGTPLEFIVCDLVSASGREYPNPGCNYFFAGENVRYQTNFRLHLLNEAKTMKTAWLSKMREFGDEE